MPLETYAKLLLADASGNAIEVPDDFDFSFTVEKSTSRDPDTADIKVFNLNSKIRESLGSTAETVEVYAGKTESPPLIFHGEVSDVINARDDNFVDWVTEIQGEDTKSRLRTHIVSQTFAAGSLVLKALQDLAAAASVSLDAPVAASKQFVSPMSFLGPPRDALQSICNRFGWRYQIRDGRVIVREEDDPIDSTNVPIISPDTGLIGVPHSEMEDRQVKTSFGCVLNPELQPGGLCSVVSTATQGSRKTGTFASGRVYYIERVIHERNDDGSDFTSFCICREA